MESESSPQAVERDAPWVTVRRWQEYAGERRANLLRVVGVAAFYSIELINHYGVNLGILQLPREEAVNDRFHLQVTLLAVAWTISAVAVHACLRNGFFPAALKFISTGIDLFLLTAILAIADGPRSPLLVGYFLLIALSGLRFNLALVRCAALGALAGYLFLLGEARWFTERDITVPRYYQLITLVALGLTGIVIGQIVRKVHGMARDYANRVQERQRP